MNTGTRLQSSFELVVEVAFANRVLKSRIPIEKKDLEDSGKKRKTVELIGKSWAADSTAFVIPELDVALDAGYPVQGKRMSSILVSHVHTDHVHHLTHMKSRSKPPNIYLPAPSVANAEFFLDAAQQLTSHLTRDEYDACEWTPSYHFHGVEPGDRLVLNHKRGLIAYAVRCDHSIPCVGYCLYQEKSFLKPEYRHLPGVEIGKLRKSGAAVTQVEEQPLLCFMGDTHAAIFEDPVATARILACPTVIVECTFLTDDCIENAARTRHVVWSQLRPHVAANPDTTFVLTHFSHRWSTRQVADFFQHPDNCLPNVIPWLPSPQTGLFCQPVVDDAGLHREEAVIDEVWSHF